MIRARYRTDSLDMSNDGSSVGYQQLRTTNFWCEKLSHMKMLFPIVMFALSLLFTLSLVNGKPYSVAKHLDSHDASRSPFTPTAPRADKLSSEGKSSLGTLEEAWEKQMKEAKKTVECEPQLQYVSLEDKLADTEYGVPVKRCPQGCGKCRHPHYKCQAHEDGSRNVTKVVRYKKHQDEVDFKYYRYVTIEEHTKCKCVLVER